MNSEESPFMLSKPDLIKLESDLLNSFPELSDISCMQIGSTKRVAILNTANRSWAIIDSSFIKKALPDFEVQEFYFSPGGKPFQSDKSKLDSEVILSDSHYELFDQLRHFSPSTLYLRVSPHTKSEYLISLCRVIFPNVVLIIEPYDLTCLFDLTVLGYDCEQNKDYQNAMLACAVAFYECDALIVKMGGQRFNSMEKPGCANIISFFPTSAYQTIDDKNVDSINLSNKLSLRPDCSETRKILYAGSLSARELSCGIGSVDGANMILYFDNVIQNKNLELTIINAAHFTADEDRTTKFSGLLERYNSKTYDQGNVIYSRAMTLDKLAYLAKNFHLGICCAHYAEDKVVEVTRVSIPNRMTTYLNAELPVIIDDRFEFASSLIEEFGAGKVIPAGDFDFFATVLAEIDIKKAREGVKRLKHFLKDENNKNLAFLLQAIR